jgi:hypothetical protein
MAKDRKPRPDLDRRAAEERLAALHPRQRVPHPSSELSREAQDNANHELWEEEKNPVGGMHYGRPPRPDEADPEE